MLNMPKCGIYKFTNKINGHIYIGQSTDISARRRSHINDAYCRGKDSNSPFHKAAAPAACRMTAGHTGAAVHIPYTRKQTSPSLRV